MLISNITVSSKILVHKYPNKEFLVPDLRFFFFNKILHLGQLEGEDFKYDKSFLKYYLKNTHIRRFVQNSDFFVFLQNFAIRQI